jgi:molybdopterin/thiamine biosynthesis adenylyltransferase/rhodanese-related sulfurtransferase
MTTTSLIPESVYYGRHYRLPGFSEAVQNKLRNARVLVVGLGGLGCPAALYLASAGVGHLVLCDGDVVSATNLHRQILFDASHVGLKKVDVAAKRLRIQNPHIKVETVDKFADVEFLRSTVGAFDVVLDGTDNFSTKFATNDACEEAGVPLVYGSIFQFEGQVSVFHHAVADAPGYSYRDLFPAPPPPGLSQNCGEAGVIGVLPGVVGCLQATEVIKLITGLGETLAGKLLMYDALTGTSDTVNIVRRQVEGGSSASAPVGDLTHEAFHALMARPQPPVLIDVRELHEREKISLGGLHIPLLKLPAHLSDIPEGQDIVVYCAAGVRSAKAALYLRSIFSDVSVLSLQGGVDAGACGVGR